jgi:guanylate kinase
MTNVAPGKNAKVGASACEKDRRHLFIVSAPSGAGKTSLCDLALSYFDDLTYSVSYTTRAPRRGEIPAKDYFFISRQEFEEGIRAVRWAEWAQVHGHFYGTSARWISETLASGRDILMDIDVQGTCRMVDRFPQCVTIFIMPPSESELKRRLQQRNTDDSKSISLRLENARAEMAKKDKYRHIIVNDNLAKASNELIHLIKTYRCGRALQPERP